jgi:predicted PurR-regulated permease PerM
MDRTTSEHGGSGAGEGSAPAAPVDEPSTQQNETQVVVTTRTLWRGVGVVLATLAGLWAVDQARELTSMLVVSLFFAISLVPAVNHLHNERGWKRGAAVGFMYLAGILVLALLTLVLIPTIAQFAERIGRDGSEWLTGLDRWTSDTLGMHIVSAEASRDAAVTTEEFLSRWSDKLVGAASGAVSSGVGFVVSVATIATFTFYIAAGFPGLVRGFLSWFSPDRQERLGWTIDQSITQVGGYLYSRLLLTAINALGFFVVMVAVGVPVGLSLALAIFGGFVSAFIPGIGTYIGGAIPVLLTFAVEGLVPALIVLGYVIVYQQIENYWLSPKISAKTMKLNAGVAFGSVLAGGALFGPMGAFMALPVAALITAFIKNYRVGHEVVYRSVYAEDESSPPAAETEARSQ